MHRHYKLLRMEMKVLYNYVKAQIQFGAHPII